ncbi:MAG: YcxB family protein [Faecousia sp.]
MDPENEKMEETTAITAEDAAEEAAEVTAAEYEEAEEAAEPMTPPLFTVNTVLCAELQMEASKAVSPKATKYVGYGAFVLAALGLVLMIYRCFAEGGSTNIVLTVFLALLMAYLVYSSLTGPKKAIARWEENMRRSFGTAELHLCTEFYDRALAQTVAEDNSLMTEGYSAITQMKETEHLILLKHSSTQWYFLAKEGFQGGTEEVEKFLTFISSKIGG